MDASHNVKKLTGQDNVFNSHFIGELKTRKTNPSIRKIQIKPIIEFSMDGLENVNFIPNEK